LPARRYRTPFLQQLTRHTLSTGIIQNYTMNIDKEFATELQNLEKMDLEAMKRRFKDDFKEIITDLDLDHLLEKSEDNIKQG